MSVARPNPRVQRTRPCASLRGSPLTRHPLGGPVTAEQFFGVVLPSRSDWPRRFQPCHAENTALMVHFGASRSPVKIWEAGAR